MRIGRIGNTDEYVYRVILPQSFLGLCVSGLLPDHPAAFHNLHGTFSGILILILSVIPMVPIRLILDAKIITEFQSQGIGIIMTFIGLVLGGVAVRFRILWLLYVGCSIPCGVGSLMIFQRLVFNHQLWFKRISKQNLG